MSTTSGRRDDDPSSSWPEVLAIAANRGGSLSILDSEGLTTKVSWADVHQEATKFAGWLHSREIGPGSIVALIARTSVDLVIAIRGVWIAGAAALIPALPANPTRSDVAAKRLTAMALRVTPDLALADSSFTKFVTDAWPIDVLDLAEDRTSGQVSDPVKPAGSDGSVLQFTSGTTDAPKPLVISGDNLRHNLIAISNGIQITTDDVLMSWLPLSHDMGLIGMLAVPMLTGASLVLTDPSNFARQPDLWLRWCSDKRATITAGPNFAYALAARFLKPTSIQSLDLSRLRLAINGSEQVNVGQFRGFLERARRYQLDPIAGFAVYGLAEATLAVTFPELGGGFESELIDEELLEKDTARPAGASTRRMRSLAVLGRPLDGVEIAIVDDHRQVAAEGHVGEIFVRGLSVVEQRATESIPGRGSHWLDTGDRGYLRKGQLVVCGRSKDIVIIGGRNIYPAELEETIGALQGIHRGVCAVVSVEAASREEIAVVVEIDDGTSHAALTNAIEETLISGWDVRPARIELVSPGHIPRTTSGKISRTAARSLLV